MNRRVRSVSWQRRSTLSTGRREWHILGGFLAPTACLQRSREWPMPVRHASSPKPQESPAGSAVVAGWVAERSTLSRFQAAFVTRDVRFRSARSPLAGTSLTSGDFAFGSQPDYTLTARSNLASARFLVRSPNGTKSRSSSGRLLAWKAKSARQLSRTSFSSRDVLFRPRQAD